MHPDIMNLLAKERIADLHREADRERLRRAAKRGRNRPTATSITVRLDGNSDADALQRLAELSERSLPSGPFIVAEVDGRIDAAVPLGGGAAVVDPFRGTAHLLQLLELRAAQIRHPSLWLRLRVLLRLRSAPT